MRQQFQNQISDCKTHAPWSSEKLAAIDFFVMANEFEQAAAETFNEDLRANFADAGAKLADAVVESARRSKLKTPTE